MRIDVNVKFAEEKVILIEIWIELNINERSSQVALISF